jgi:PAS domain S-box-containing protein
METVTRPPDEDARLRTLRSCDVLDTGPEAVYDDVTRLLSLTCDVPMAVVTLVDEHRQWFKSAVGVDCAELPRENGFCAQAVADCGELIVEDTLQDERFREHAMVVGAPHVRFYAGAPIVMPDGQTVGAVAVLDTRPRQLTSAQLETLAAMARQVQNHLELRRRIRSQDETRVRLEQATERLDLVVEASSEGIWDLDLGMRSLFLSPRVFAMLGLSSATGAVPLAGIWPIVHPEDRRGIRRAVVQRMRCGEPFEHEFRCRIADDGWRWFRARAVAASGTDGGRRLVGSIVDIHEHRTSREALQRASRLLAESQALARVGGWELDLLTDELFWTAETYRIHETSPNRFQPNVDEAIEFYAPEGRPRLRAALEDAVARGRAYSLDLELVTARGRRLWVRVTGGAVFVKGRAVRVLGAIQDISAQRRMDEELLHAKEAAEAASEAKSAFLAAMSHEIRTPMHTVLGYTDMLGDSQLDVEQRECVEIISSSGNSLLRLIDDILDFSKVEAGKMVLERLPFDVHRVATEVARMMQPLASNKGLVVEVEGDAALQVAADPQRTHQVLVNLAGNAVKFTVGGAVTIALSQRGDLVRCEVRDTGIGIPADQLPRLFDDFVQVDSSARRKFGGTGLGLAISKQLVEAMGGRIGVESEPGVGSTFWFELPAAAARTEHDEDDDPADTVVGLDAMQGRRVLVVEDNRLNLRLAVRVLETFGLEVAVAIDGESAIEMVESQPFDLVLMDCLMPGMDGFEATRRIRERETGSGRRLPIVALTANALPEDREACLAAGMDDFVSKPFTKQALQAATARWLPAVD